MNWLVVSYCLPLILRPLFFFFLAVTFWSPIVFHLFALPCFMQLTPTLPFVPFILSYFCHSPGISWPPQTRRTCSHWTISQCGIAEQLSTQLDSFYTTCPDRRLEVEDIALLSKNTHRHPKHSRLQFYFSAGSAINLFVTGSFIYSLQAKTAPSSYMCVVCIRHKFGKFEKMFVCVSSIFRWILCLKFGTFAL